MYTLAAVYTTAAVYTAVAVYTAAAVYKMPQRNTDDFGSSPLVLGLSKFAGKVRPRRWIRKVFERVRG